MSKYVCNALSLQMIKFPVGAFQFCEISEEMFKTLSAGAESYVGHKDIASYLNLPYNRSNLELKGGDLLYVAQLCRGRHDGLIIADDEDDRYIKYYQVTVMEGA